MTRKATTVRLDPELQEGLELLARTQRRTRNQIVNDAVRDHLIRRIRAAELDLEATLARLRRHRGSDPDGVRSLEAAMRDEAGIEDDPADGGRRSAAATGSETAGMLDRLTG